MKRVYRAIALYADGDVVTRHFLTKRSPDSWAEQRREGYPESGGSYMDEPERPAIPPAVRVDVDESQPVVFSSAAAPTLATVRADDTQRADHYQDLYESAAQGRCGYSGMPLSTCKATDICDCFDFEWLRAPAEAVGDDHV